MFALDTVCELREIADRAEYLAKRIARNDRPQLLNKYRSELSETAARLRVALDDIDAGLTPKMEAVRDVA